MPQLTSSSGSTPIIPISTECHSCGKMYSVHHLHTHEDNSFCGDCMRGMGLVRCCHCDEWVKKDETREYDGDPICESCYEEDYFTCEDCTNVHRQNRAFRTSYDTTICRDCYREGYFTCDNCGDVRNSDEANSTDSSTYCEYCFNEMREECASCGEECCRHDMNNIRRIGNVCSSCRPKINIENYGYKPSPKFFGKGKFFLGIELEVHCDNICQSLNTFSSSDLDRLYVKEDGSVHHGFEIVSHPMTIESHREFDWVDFCDRMYDSGAHGNKEEHGIHIHISKMYLSELQRLRLSWFLCHHFEEVAAISRRSECYCQGRDADCIIDDIKRKRTYSGGRNEILNWSPRDTVEFRLPLASLRGETVLALLELCDAAVKFVQEDNGFMQLTDCWETFMRWCAKNNYTALVGYFIAEGMGEIDER